MNKTAHIAKIDQLMNDYMLLTPGVRRNFWAILRRCEMAVAAFRAIATLPQDEIRRIAVSPYRPKENDRYDTTR
jgi:hypothetical protein